jgi:hypothetical protein
MRNIYILRLLLFTIVILSLSFCTPKPHDRDKDGVADDKDKCPDVYALTKNGCPVREINKVHFFLDISASMGGYFQQDAEYKTILSDLTAKIDKRIKPIDIWFIADTLSKYPNSVEQFSSDIATTKIADRKSSELHEIIRKIAKSTAPNDVSLFVSDCILSFPDSDIRANKEINRQEAPNALKDHIFSTFSDLKKEGFATSVYAFKSKFYGTYYDYQNTRTQLEGSERPFYLWVIGNKEVLGKFESGLGDISTFSPEEYLHFGMLEEPVTNYSIAPQIERKGKWSKGKTGSVSDINMKDNGPLQICALVNLESLPAYAQNVAYLQKNLQITTSGCDAKFEVKNKSAVDKSKLKNEKQLEAFEENTHAIMITVSAMPLTTASIHFTLPLKYDNWYSGWSTNDDKDILSQQGKTFALNFLIDGVKEAYETKNKNYIDFSINLNK